MKDAANQAHVAVAPCKGAAMVSAPPSASVVPAVPAAASTPMIDTDKNDLLAVKITEMKLELLAVKRTTQEIQTDIRAIKEAVGQLSAKK